jgi:hypothetical protein
MTGLDASLRACCGQSLVLARACRAIAIFVGRQVIV